MYRPLHRDRLVLPSSSPDSSGSESASSPSSETSAVATYARSEAEPFVGEDERHGGLDPTPGEMQAAFPEVPEASPAVAVSSDMPATTPVLGFHYNRPDSWIPGKHRDAQKCAEGQVDPPQDGTLVLSLSDVDTIKARIPTQGRDDRGDPLPTPELFEDLPRLVRWAESYLRCRFKYTCRWDGIPELLLKIVNGLLEIFQIYLDAVLDHAGKNRENREGRDLELQDFAFDIELHLRLQVKDLIGLSDRVTDTVNETNAKSTAFRRSVFLYVHKHLVLTATTGAALSVPEEVQTRSGRISKAPPRIEQARKAAADLAAERKRRADEKKQRHGPAARDTATLSPAPPTAQLGGPSLLARIRNTGVDPHVPRPPAAGLTSPSWIYLTRPEGGSASALMPMRREAWSGPDPHHIQGSSSLRHNTLADSVDFVSVSVPEVTRGPAQMKLDLGDLLPRHSPLADPSSFSTSRKPPFLPCLGRDGVSMHSSSPVDGLSSISSSEPQAEDAARPFVGPVEGSSLSNSSAPSQTHPCRVESLPPTEPSGPGKTYYHPPQSLYNLNPAPPAVPGVSPHYRPSASANTPAADASDSVSHSEASRNIKKRRRR